MPAPLLAEAADILGKHLKRHLQRLATFIGPHADALDRSFEGRLKRLQVNAPQRACLLNLTPCAAARLLCAGRPLKDFLEQVEYNGRRLAKLNLSPGAIVRALSVYEALLAKKLMSLDFSDATNLEWARRQLQFCVILTLNNVYYHVRQAETQAFYELSRVELEAQGLDELLGNSLEVLSHFCNADAARFLLRHENGPGFQLSASTGAATHKAGTVVLSARPRHERRLSRPLLVQSGTGAARDLLDAAWRRRFNSCWSVPLVSGGRLEGLMQFGFRRRYDWLPRERELLLAAAERCLIAAERVRLVEDLRRRREQVQALAEHISQVEEYERSRISRELHDDTGQSLLYIRLQLELLEKQLPEELAAARSALREVRGVAEQTILELRSVIAALSPAVLEQLGLEAAVRQLVNRFRRLHRCRIHLQMSAPGRLPRRVETTAYRLLQECFNNIAKHSGASRVNVLLQSADGFLRMSVDDNGDGFLVDKALRNGQGFGLAGMRERVALLGGTFEIESTPRRRPPVPAGNALPGTRIRVALPVNTESSGWCNNNGQDSRHVGG